MRRICKSWAALVGKWFMNSPSVLPTSQVVYQPINRRNLWCGLLLLYNNSEDMQFFHEFTGAIKHSWLTNQSARIDLVIIYRGFNKHRHPMKSVGYFDQTLATFCLDWSNNKEWSLRSLANTVAYSSQTGCLLQTLLKPQPDINDYH